MPTVLYNNLWSHTLSTLKRDHFIVSIFRAPPEEFVKVRGISIMHECARVVTPAANKMTYANDLNVRVCHHLSQFTRIQRIVVVASVFITSMTVVAMVYGNHPTSIQGNIATALFAAVFMIPCRVLLPRVFQAANAHPALPKWSKLSSIVAMVMLKERKRKKELTLAPRRMRNSIFATALMRHMSSRKAVRQPSVHPIIESPSEKEASPRVRCESASGYSLQMVRASSVPESGSPRLPGEVQVEGVRGPETTSKFLFNKDKPSHKHTTNPFRIWRANSPPITVRRLSAGASQSWLCVLRGCSLVM